MVTVGATPEKALHAAAGGRAHRAHRVGRPPLGAVHDLPEKVNDDFGGVYRYMRDQRM